MSDLKERLRALSEDMEPQGCATKRQRERIALIDEAADRIEAMEGLLREARDEIEAEVEAKRGTVLTRTTERDLDIVRRIDAILSQGGE